MKIKAERPPRSNVLLIGDLLVFILFPVLGASNHESALTTETFVRTTLTLAVSWYIVATFIGLYANRITHSIRRVMPRTLLAWAIAGPIALTTRILLFDRPFDLAFSLVALGVTGALLVTWRAVYALVPRKRSAED